MSSVTLKDFVQPDRLLEGGEGLQEKLWETGGEVYEQN